MLAKSFCLRSSLAGGWVVLILTIGPAGLAQVIPDDTMPAIERSQVSPGPTIQITGGAVRGTNLFHSFQAFSIPTGSSVIFNNAAAIRNIISRVTGPSPSTIDGLMQANGTANLFLINPNGIIFGPNAQLNLGGSFVATTAVGLQFGNQGNFTATNPDPPGLLTINPSALLFSQLGGAIRSQANLAVTAGQSLILAGQPIALTGGSLRAPGGWVELAGIGGTGSVDVPATDGLSLAVPETLPLADVSLRSGTEVNVQAGGGGSISVNAENLSLANGSILRAGIAAQQGSVESQAGDVAIRASGAIRLSDTSFIANSVLGTGNSGNVTLTADSVSLSNGSQINASTFGNGDGGTISILARGAVNFDGEDLQQNASGTFSRVNPGAVGNSGGIVIRAESLSVTNGALLTASTLGQGNAGSVTIATQEGVRFAGVGANSRIPSGAYSGVDEGAIGNSGGINITAASLAAEQGAQLDASTNGIGNSGKITIQTLGAVKLGGGVPVGIPDPGGLYSFVGERGLGNSGGISLQAGALSMIEGAAAVATTFGRGNAGNVQIQVTGPIALDGQYGRFSTGIFSSVSPIAIGNGGDIALTANSLTVTRGAAIAASTLGRGNAANITVTVSSTALFDGVSQDSAPTGSAIFSRVGPAALGNSGNISLTAQSLVLTNGGQLQASTRGQGNGGDIQVRADRITIAGIEPNTQIASGIFSTTTANSTGVGGDINLRSRNLTLNNGGEISAQSLGTGRSGSISLTVRDRLQGRNGQISTASAQVSGGAIAIQAGQIRLSGSSSITTSVFSGEGGGGDITLAADAILLLDDTDILAFSRDGRGGNITLRTPVFYGFQYKPAPPGVDPTTLRGNGKVDINASGRLSAGIIALPDIGKLQNTVVQLPAAPVDTDSLIANSCIVQRSHQGSLVITGAGGIPTQPDDLASVPFSTYELAPLPADRSSTVANPAIAEADGIYRLSTGEIFLGLRCN
ncbi:MAG: hypothetical protein OHK0047_29290 [Leptolyngbyaceae cyanobacterium]